MIYRGIFYPAFFLCACERSFETASFCLKFWLFLSRRPRKLILSIFSKSKRPFEKQTTPRLVTYLCLSMDKIWAKMIFWLWPRNFDFARYRFALNKRMASDVYVTEQDIFFSISRNIPRSEKAYVVPLLRIILWSFKLHIVFLISKYLREIFCCTNTNKVRCFKLLLFIIIIIIIIIITIIIVIIILLFTVPTLY